MATGLGKRSDKLTSGPMTMPRIGFLGVAKSSGLWVELLVRGVGLVGVSGVD